MPPTCRKCHQHNNATNFKKIVWRWDSDPIKCFLRDFNHKWNCSLRFLLTIEKISEATSSSGAYSNSDSDSTTNWKVGWYRSGSFETKFSPPFRGLQGVNEAFENRKSTENFQWISPYWKDWWWGVRWRLLVLLYSNFVL